MGKILVLSFSSLVCIVLSLVAIEPQVARAQITEVLTAPFGGRIFSIMYLPFFCPPHVIINDVEGSIGGVPRKIGIIPVGRIYDYKNLYTPQVWTLGNRLRVAVPCPYPYPVYKMTIVGTSATP